MGGKEIELAVGEPVAGLKVGLSEGLPPETVSGGPDKGPMLPERNSPNNTAIINRTTSDTQP